MVNNLCNFLRIVNIATSCYGRITKSCSGSLHVIWKESPSGDVVFGSKAQLLQQQRGPLALEQQLHTYLEMVASSTVIGKYLLGFMIIFFIW